MRTPLALFAFCGMILAQTDRPLSGLQNRYTLAELNRMKTDDRISFLEKKLAKQPNDAQMQGLLAAVFLQKLRETIDPVYLQRAANVVDKILSANPKSYSALRL